MTMFLICLQTVDSQSNRCNVPPDNSPVILTAETGVLFGALLLFDGRSSSSPADHLLPSIVAVTSSTGPGKLRGSGGPDDGFRRHSGSPGGHRCSWHVRAATGQRVIFRLAIYRLASIDNDQVCSMYIVKTILNGQ